MLSRPIKARKKESKKVIYNNKHRRHWKQQKIEEENQRTLANTTSWHKYVSRRR
jgi:hypothetical protein